LVKAKAYLHAKFHCDPPSRLATIDMDRGLYGRRQSLRPKISNVEAAVPLSVGGAASPSYTVWPGPRPTRMPSFILIYPTVWPQYINVTDRQDRTGQTDRQDNGPIG